MNLLRVAKSSFDIYACHDNIHFSLLASVIHLSLTMSLSHYFLTNKIISPLSIEQLCLALSGNEVFLISEFFLMAQVKKTLQISGTILLETFLHEMGSIHLKKRIINIFNST